ncbi:4'-phosphopantetheinyl transferase family protein [Pedobacter alluvionis]|uniref:4'-phosphopantetheinyl transferase superfamily protein n=1 Tax=Pedobacter alluvionis TaxID=475253 RepID=A0A497Y7Q3_9SPHI|nr:4'-phosphopantetheinyl transferase superfamily protein [Pedobacter alluvionis]RLJ76998.1 4'-phosphopantetheinyl transferase superfamily protein [Pedobacter alluvionis]TFB33752.1 4-phosphopantetheinyl transferase family protein [Pedobacter alluvionis]
MLGNDIVDLDLAKIQSNWRRKNYLNKIFTAEEQLLITSAEKPDEVVWLLWSMKESAYKIHNRKTGIRNFAPKSLNCTVYASASEIKGKVSIDNDTYFTKSDIQLQYIHTIAAPVYSRLEEIKVAIYELPNHPHDYKRTKPGSISHHGQYLALVY